jgi:predicted O-methyltransferase YrrM
MKHPLQESDKKLFLQIAVVAAIALGVAWLLGGAMAGEAVLAALILLVGVEVLAVHRKAESRARQQDAMLALYATFQSKAPLPDLQDWSAMPDLLKKLLELVLLERPTVILEAGSGASTLVCAAALKKLGRGQVISLDHDAQFAAQTSAWLTLHELSDYAKIIHAPLVSHSVRGESRRWYDLAGAGLESTPSIDLIVTDGPPGRDDALARYPALPLLHAKLRSGGLVLLDDADRDDEREIVRRWCAEFPDMSSQYLPLVKGAALLRKA